MDEDSFRIFKLKHGIRFGCNWITADGIKPQPHQALRHSPRSNFKTSAQATILYNKFENYTFKLTATSPGDQWINFDMVLK